MKCWLSFIALSFVLATGHAIAADHYVATDGRADARGTIDSPWNIQSAYAGERVTIDGGLQVAAPSKYLSRFPT